ncbi:phosphatidylinositol/phosphatidylcholine transfer protein SFH1-like isoform X1 [Selaginella moellendorffii]|uniref:phosphatidylinositol/phosphatidylcholine transfer protein SFH1-like isoform X1 n=1 Tax=Selaginella moellendorffii TaxID=88036 RepID=UPI000D1CA77E|nr:phosphatidylinositol/phosphatidylcholine transfer protein SFH1-like isoform X1 [Selaginella moellendorffii]|eukprot:XP_024522002.1 phosphatidylinositol/phosphatidylcholine transfer protein SFH1-like isoform X1 [Selaginella moellendorffii]
MVDALDESQNEALERLQKLLGDRQIQGDVDTLVRFLKARSFDVWKAKAMYEAMLQWRAEVRADAIKQEFDFQERDATQELYPRFYHKVDKLGRPIYIERLGKLRLEELFKVTSMERMLLDHIKEWEIFVDVRLPAASRDAGRAITQSLAILDLKGVVKFLFFFFGSFAVKVSIFFLASLLQVVKHVSKQVRQFVRAILRIDQDFYPEFLGKMVIVNAPVYFKALWSIVKPWLDNQTQKKIEVHGTNYVPRLLELVDAESLPSFLGGSCECVSSRGCESSNAGPWLGNV